MTQRKIRRLGGIAAVAAAALVTAGCSAAPAEPPVVGGTLDLATSTPGAYNHFNPWGAGYGINNSLWIAQALYDSLVRLDAEGQPVPSLATSWEIDGETVTLELREGVEFADGTPLDADAVKANLDYAAANRSGAECNTYVADITTEVLSATSIQLDLPHPMPELLQDLGQCAGFIVNPSALEDPEASLALEADGTGPYTVNTDETNIAQSKFVFDRNPEYWDQANAGVWEKIVLTGYSDRPSAINAIRGGQADVLANQPVLEVRDIGVSTIESQPQQLIGAWITDTTGDLVPALGDVRVRQALNLGIDAEAIAQGLYPGVDLQITPSTPFPSYYTGFDDSLADIYAYDPDEAQDLLAEAGYPDGITIPVLVSPLQQQMAEAFAGYYEEVGITLDLSVHSSDFISQMLSGSWPMVFANFTLNPAELQTIRGVVGPDGFWNPRGNADEDVQDLIAEIQSTPLDDEESLESLYAELAELVAERALLVTPFILPSATAFDGDKVDLQNLVPGVSVPMLYHLAPAS